MPVSAKAPMGYFHMEPVLISKPTTMDLISAIEKVREFGNPTISSELVAELRKKIEPVQKAARKSSQKELARTGAAYDISWLDECVAISMSTLDKKGRWIFDRNKERRFPIDTNIQALVETILEDAKSRPEIW